MDGSSLLSRFRLPQASNNPSTSACTPQTKSKEKSHGNAATTMSCAGNGDDDEAPPKPPPKDAGYSPYGILGTLPQRSQTSLAPPTSTRSIPPTPQSPSRWHTLTSHALDKIGATIYGGVSPASSQTSLVMPSTPATPPQASSSATRSKFRLPRLKRPSNSRSTSSGQTEDDLQSITGSTHGAGTGDEGISTPWNFKHNVHVDESFVGLPMEWTHALQDAGFTSEQVHALYSKQKAQQLAQGGRPSTSTASSHSPSPPRPSPSAPSPQPGPSSAPPQSSSVVVPRPRKDSIKHLERSLKSSGATALTVTSPTGETSVSSIVHAPKESIDGTVTIAVATPVKRTPSRLRRIPAPSLPSLRGPSPPPAYSSSFDLPAPSLVIPFPSSSPSIPADSSNNITFQSSLTDSPVERPSLDKPLPKSPSTLRQAIQSTIRHAKSTTSLRKGSGNSDSSNPATLQPALPLPSSSTSPPRRGSDGMGTFWDDADEDMDEADEGADQVSPLPLGMKRSNRSLRASAVPPRLELSLPTSDETSSQRSRKDSNESPAPSLSFSLSSSTPKPTLNSTNLFSTLDSGDLGLGEWGTELLKAVIADADESKSGESSAGLPPESAADRNSKTSTATSWTTSQSSIIASPTSISTNFSSVTSHNSSQQASSSRSNLSIAEPPRPVSLLPVIPLNIPPHKKVNAKPSPPSATAPPASKLPPPSSAIRVTTDATASSGANAGPAVVRVTNKHLSKLVTSERAMGASSGQKPPSDTDSPIIPPSPFDVTRRPIVVLAPAPISSSKKTLPPPPLSLPTTPSPSTPIASLKPDQDPGQQLEILISEEYADDVSDALLSYMQASPAPTQAVFSSVPMTNDKLSPIQSSAPMSRSASTVTSESSSDGTFGSQDPVFGLASPSTVMSAYGLPSPSAESTASGQGRFSTMTITPLTIGLAQNGNVPCPKAPVSPSAGASMPYDAVLDDWLESEAEEAGEVNEQDEDQAHPSAYDVLEIDEMLHPSSPLASPSPSIPSPKQPLSKKASAASFGSSSRLEPGGPTQSLLLQGPKSPKSPRSPRSPNAKGSVKKQQSSLPPALVPLASYVQHGNVRKFSQFQQVAEGQSGGVYSARAGTSQSSSPGYGKQKVVASVVAVKAIPVIASSSSKFTILQRELQLLERVNHKNVLTFDGVYHVDEATAREAFGGVASIPDGMLWVEMELMERSLADVLAFMEEGLVIEEARIARIAHDILEGLRHLHGLDIAHRDVRSDNLLFSRYGVLKLADFSSATVASGGSAKRTSTQGQPPYWMAPEMRRGKPYDPQEVDIWSAGATIWEVAEGNPPFIEIEDPKEFLDRLPDLSNPGARSRQFHDFLKFCSQPAGKRPSAAVLLKTAFAKLACPVSDMVTLLSQVKVMEDGAHERDVDYGEEDDDDL